MPIDASGGAWPRPTVPTIDPAAAWRWLEPQDALACLRAHGVMDHPSPSVPDSRTLPAQRRATALAARFLRMAARHELPGTRYITQIGPDDTRAWWMTVLVQEHPNVRLAIACAVPWAQAGAMHPNGRETVALEAMPTILMARSGQAFEEASVHASMTSAFVGVEEAFQHGALDNAWQAREKALLHAAVAGVDLPASDPVPPRRRL